MPDINKAILDPFSPLSVPEALMVAVCGLVVVFMMLAILALVIIIISKIVNSVALRIIWKKDCMCMQENRIRQKALKSSTQKIK